MKDYTKLGLTPFLRNISSLPEKQTPIRTALEWDILDERSSYISGNVTYSGGTLIDVFIGTATLKGGTVNNTTFGTPNTTGGTIRNTVLNNNIVGTPAITGGNYNTGTFAGTPIITNPSITNGTANTLTLGTPAIVGGTASSFTFSNKINVLVGANLSVGKGTLASGVATISTTTVGTNSNIYLTPIASGANLGILAVGTINAGTNFVIQSSNILDSDSFNYWIIN